MEVAKSKYQRMIEVRQKSFVEKKQLSKVYIHLYRKDKN